MDQEIKDQQSTNHLETTPNNQHAHLAQETESDPELDDLLDSALEDFSKPDLSSSVATTSSQYSSGESKEIKHEPSPSGAANFPAGIAPQLPQDAMFNEVFNEEAQKQLEDMMKAFMAQDPDMMKNIEKLSEAAGTSDDTEEGRKNFEQTLQDTLGNLAQNAEEIQSEVPEDELFKLLGNLNMGDIPGATGNESAEGTGDMSSFMPMMQGMMKSLLSKDVLYPSLKDISEKYPNWLETNKDKTDPKDLENYNKQYEYMNRICSEYEQETDSDSEIVKKERFDRVLQHMQNMQELGYPPKELVGDMPAFEGALGGLSNMTQGAEQCNLM